MELTLAIVKPILGACAGSRDVGSRREDSPMLIRFGLNASGRTPVLLTA